MALENTFRVAIFEEFFDAFARIPRAQQKKLHKFLRKFREDPTNSSINYESISTFIDPNLRTARIDQAYRAIVLKPEQGNVYVLLWVDHHDEAMRWAQNKLISIHPETGSLQVLSREVPAQPPPEPRPPERSPLFEGASDQELMRLGVPALLSDPSAEAGRSTAFGWVARNLPRPQRHERLRLRRERDDQAAAAAREAL